MLPGCGQQYLVTEAYGVGVTNCPVAENREWVDPQSNVVGTYMCAIYIIRLGYASILPPIDFRTSGCP